MMTQSMFGPVRRWREGNILLAANDFATMAYCITDDPRMVGRQGWHKPGDDGVMVEWITAEQAAPLWGNIINTRCPYCDGNGWIDKGFNVGVSSGRFTCDVMVRQRTRCPARCDRGTRVLAKDICARSIT